LSICKEELVSSQTQNVGDLNCSRLSALEQLGELNHAKGDHYRKLSDLVRDEERLKLFADAAEISLRNMSRDECGQWTLNGKKGHLQTFDDAFYLLYVSTHSKRKWGALKRKAKSLGWEITQDGDDEGCFRLKLPNESQSRFLREILGLRTRRGSGRTVSSITRRVQHLNNGASDDFVSCSEAQATRVTALA
jgi:hypothetical protein